MADERLRFKEGEVPEICCVFPGFPEELLGDLGDLKTAFSRALDGITLKKLLRDSNVSDEGKRMKELLRLWPEGGLEEDWRSGKNAEEIWKMCEEILRVIRKDVHRADQRMEADQKEDGAVADALRSGSRGEMKEALKGAGLGEAVPSELKERVAKWKGRK